MRSFSYIALLGLCVVLMLLWQPRENGLPLAAGRPMVRVEAIEGFALDAGAGLPAWRAARATPRSAGRFLTLAGAINGLQLTGISVTLGDGIEMTARAGAFEGDRLRLGPDVRVQSRGDSLLVSAAVEIGNGQFVFPGIVAFHPSSGRELDLAGVTMSASELLRRLR